MKISKEEKNKWFYENKFYQTSEPDRFFKLIYHFEIYKKILNIKGDFFEFGVFKGSSFIRFLTFAKLFRDTERKFYGFDTFGKFPAQKKIFDKKFVKMWVEKAGDSLDLKSLNHIIKKKKLTNFKLIKGDIFFTLEKFLKNYKKKIALLHLDLDTYEPTKFALDNMYKFLKKGSIILCDDYNAAVGATKAINEFLKEKNCKIKKLKYHKKPYFIEIKNKI